MTAHGYTKLEGEGPEKTDRALPKEDILRWFQRSSEHDGIWVLKRLQHSSSHLFEEIISSHASQSRAPDTSSPETTNQVVKAKDTLKSISHGEPIVQFTSNIFYAKEGEDDIMVLDVMRIGNCEGTTEVCYETQEGTALAGRSFVPTSGKILFAPGDTMQSIHIQILNNDLWDTTLEFGCKLLLEGLKGGKLGMYLAEARVKIIDNDSFPNNAFGGLKTSEEISKVSNVSLMLGYFQLVANIPTVWMGTMKFLLVEIIHSLWHLLALFMRVYVLDYIIDTSSSADKLFLTHDRQRSLLMCASVTVALHASSHWLDYARISFPIAGPARKFTQRSLLRKFLNYAPIVHEHLRQGDVQMGIQSDSVQLATHGYQNLLKACGVLMKVTCIVTFKAASSFIFGKTFDWHGFVYFSVAPMLMTLYLCARERTTSAALKKRHGMESHLVSNLARATVGYNLVLHYNLRNFCEQKFVERQTEYGNAAKAANQVLMNNTYFCKWCQCLLMTFWFWYGGVQVIQGYLTVGLFVTNMGIIESLGSASVELYNIYVDMTTVYPALENVTLLMNQPSDVSQRHAQKRASRALSKKLRATLPRTAILPCDAMPIIMNFIDPFKFDGKEDTALNLKSNGEIKIQQGQLVAVVGPRGCGKATLLHLIGGATLPSADREHPVFVPSHLRVANVADEPLFFSGTLYENLVFGMRKESSSAAHERVKNICIRLTNNHTISDHLDDLSMEMKWYDIFSGAECKLLSIARALIQNYEVICIHKAFSKLHSKDGHNLMQVLHDHIQSKGLELHNHHDRRPRTVFISVEDAAKLQDKTHAVLRINPFEGIKMVAVVQGSPAQASPGYAYTAAQISQTSRPGTADENMLARESPEPYEKTFSLEPSIQSGL